MGVKAFLGRLPEKCVKYALRACEIHPDGWVKYAASGV